MIPRSFSMIVFKTLSLDFNLDLFCLINEIDHCRLSKSHPQGVNYKHRNVDIVCFFELFNDYRKVHYGIYNELQQESKKNRGKKHLGKLPLQFV